MANNYTQFSTQIECATEEQATWLAEELNKDGEFGPSCDAEIQEDNKTVWLNSEENADLERIVDVLCEFQNCFKLTDAITFSWAHTCSKPRLDEFGGGAVVVKNGKDYWIDAQQWAQKKIDELA